MYISIVNLISIAQAKPFGEEKGELQATLRKAQQRLKDLQQNVRQQLRDAHAMQVSRFLIYQSPACFTDLRYNPYCNAMQCNAMQTPEEIDAVLESASKYGDAVRNDIR